MNLLTIPFRNMRRKPTKTLLLTLLFSLGIISIVALYQVSLVVGLNLEQKLTSYGANIVVSPNRETLSLSYGGFHMGDVLYDIQELSEKQISHAIETIEYKDRISVVAPKLVTMIRVEETAVALVGVRWEQERAMKSHWAAQGNYPEHDNQVLLGAHAAEKLGLQIGDSVMLHGTSFTISGTLYETGSDDDSVILVDLAVLQGLIERPGAASFVEVSALCAGCPIDDIVSQIRANLPQVSVTALQDVVSQRMVSVHFVQKLALSISLVILLTASAMIGLSMLSAVHERKKDIGILRSLGYSRSRIFLIFCLEAGLIGACAGAVGYFIGFYASLKALSLLSIADGATPMFSLAQLILVTGGFALIAMLAALYPSWKGAAVEPSQALTAL